MGSHGQDPTGFSESQWRKRRQAVDTHAVQTRRDAIRNPLIMLAIGSSLSMIAQWPTSLHAALAAVLLIVIVAAVAALLYTLLGLLWLGLNEGVLVTALNAAAVSSIALISGSLCTLIPLPFLGMASIVQWYGVPIVIAAAVMTSLMDLDVQDALLASALSIGPALAVGPIAVDGILG